MRSNSENIYKRSKAKLHEAMAHRRRLFPDPNNHSKKKTKLIMLRVVYISTSPHTTLALTLTPVLSTLKV